MNKNTQKLYQQGVSLWLDNITRKIIKDGTLKKYITEFGITGLTSNPTIFDNAIAGSDDYDNTIKKLGKAGLSDEEVFFQLAVEDIQHAADLFLPVYEKTNGLDGFVSIEVSPLLAYDTDNTVKAAKELYEKVNRPNAFIKIPGTPEGLPAIEKTIAEGIPVNVTLLFSPEQYINASEAWLKGIETRIENGLNPDVRSVASIFVSRWDKAVEGMVSKAIRNKVGIAVMQKTYKSYLMFLHSERIQKLMNLGVSPQRLLWASTGTKDPNASDILYVKELVAPFTVNTMPENTLLAFADHGEAVKAMSRSDAEADIIFQKMMACSINHKILAGQLQSEGAEAFTKSWTHLMETISNKRSKL